MSDELSKWEDKEVKRTEALIKESEARIANWESDGKLRTEALKVQTRDVDDLIKHRVDWVTINEKLIHEYSRIADALEIIARKGSQ